MLICVESYAKPDFYSCLVGVKFINPSLYFVNASFCISCHYEKHEG